MRSDRRVLLAGALAAGAAPVRAADARPRRIVSLISCLDTMLVHLADRGQIAALSHYARDPEASTIAAVARTLPFTHGTAEEILALRPDLVLGSVHGAPATRNALQRLGVATEVFGVPQSVAESLEQVRRMARAVGHPDRGEALVARIEAALAAAAPPPGARRYRALVYQGNGFAAGPGTLADELLRHCGFVNAAPRFGLQRWGNVPLETLLANPPDVLLVGEPSRGGRSWADRTMTHPALKSVAGRMRQASLPERYLYCGGPVLIDAARSMAAAYRGMSA